MTTDRINYLLSQYLDDKATISERDELAAMLNEPETIPVLTDRLQAMIDTSQHLHQWSSDKLDQMLQNVLSSDKTGEEIAITPVRRMFWKRIAVAASILLVIGLSSYFLFFNKPANQTEIANTQEQRFKNDVNPGGYKARLTLADGRIIVLDSAAAGELAKQGNTVVLNKDGQLVYDASHSPLTTDHSPIYNMLSTSKGETYATVLADGSKVWLNSASSIKYPVAFVGKERRVEITGEAYFEVKHNEAMPFIVKINTPSGDGGEVHDLGTEFNINAYSDEATIKTTLISGSAKVLSTASAKGTVIKPGEQAVFNPANPLIPKILVQTNADIDEATAWRNGRFLFKSTDIKALMRQLTRWYDVEVSYETTPTTGFNAKISRETPLSSILKALELTGEVKFRIEGKRVTVMK